MYDIDLLTFYLGHQPCLKRSVALLSPQNQRFVPQAWPGCSRRSPTCGHNQQLGRFFCYFRTDAINVRPCTKGRGTTAGVILLLR
jgi:hypothetical protein